MQSFRGGLSFVAVGILTVALTGCSGSPATSACLDSIKTHLGAEFTGVEVTEDLRTPGGSIDIRGTYDGGNSFTCALSTPPLELHQVLVHTFDGEIITVKL